MRVNLIAAITVFAFCLIETPQVTAEQPSIYSPQPEHEILKKMVGRWTFEEKSIPRNEANPISGSGTVTSKMLGKMFVVNRWEGTLFGKDFEALQTLGYSLSEKKYVGTWIDSTMSHQWQMEGEWNEKANRLVGHATGPDSDDGPTEYKETYHFVNPHYISVKAEFKLNGKWVPFMHTELRRIKDIEQQPAESREVTSKASKQ